MPVASQWLWVTSFGTTATPVDTVQALGQVPKGSVSGLPGESKQVLSKLEQPPLPVSLGWRGVRTGGTAGVVAVVVGDPRRLP